MKTICIVSSALLLVLWIVGFLFLNFDWFYHGLVIAAIDLFVLGLILGIKQRVKNKSQKINS